MTLLSEVVGLELVDHTIPLSVILVPEIFPSTVAEEPPILLLPFVLTLGNALIAGPTIKLSKFKFKSPEKFKLTEVTFTFLLKVTCELTL